MPPRRYLQGFTLCVPLADEGGGGPVGYRLVKHLIVKADRSLARLESHDLVVRVEIRLVDLTEECGGDSGDFFPTEVHLVPFPDSRIERRAFIERIVAKPPLLPVAEHSTEHRD